jgi:hypothetical protein
MATSLIAIHGWGSHPLGGFKAAKDPFVWLRDGLTRDHPEFRVYVYGYPCDPKNKNSNAGVYEYANTLFWLLKGIQRQDQV